VERAGDVAEAGSGFWFWPWLWGCDWGWDCAGSCAAGGAGDAAWSRVIGESRKTAEIQNGKRMNYLIRETMNSATSRLQEHVFNKEKRALTSGQPRQASYT
jgi:hypothetical protein